MAVQRQVPEARLPLAVAAQLVAGLPEAAVEAQVVSDGVLPAVRSGLEEGEVLPVGGRGGNTDHKSHMSRWTGQQTVDAHLVKL